MGVQVFEKTLPIILKFEGGYVDHPKDPGGATNKGITQKTYNTYRKLWQLSPQHVRYITNGEVKKIYESYWRDSKSDTIAKTHPNTSLVHFDFAVNAGIKQAAKTLQRSLGSLDIDGRIGPKTLSAISLTSDVLLSDLYLDERRLFYVHLTEKRPALKVFLKGWLYRVNKIERLIDEWSTQRNQSTDTAPSIT